MRVAGGRGRSGSRDPPPGSRPGPAGTAHDPPSLLYGEAGRAEVTVRE